MSTAHKPPRVNTLVFGRARHTWLAEALSAEGVRIVWYEDDPARWTGSRIADNAIQSLANVWHGTSLARRHKAPLVLWSPREGIIAGLLGSLCAARRVPVLALNLIAFPQVRLRGRIRDWLFRVAFARSRLAVTVNSEWVRQLYIAQFGIPPDRIHVLYDCWLPKWLDDKEEPGQPDHGYVFAGGTAARDWMTLLRAAALLPQIPFRIIARARDWPPDRVLPENVEVIFDTSEDCFWDTARKARIELVCLSSPITAGLVVLILSSLIGRPVISTQTPVTEPYYPESHRDLLVRIGDHHALAHRIRALWENERLRNDSALALQNHILTNHTPQAYSRRVREIIESELTRSTGG